MVKNSKPLTRKGWNTMEVILGIDMGGSATKLVSLGADGGVISMLQLPAQEQLSGLSAMLDTFLRDNNLSPLDVRRVVLTGVGASYVDGDIGGLPTCKVDEFLASSTGALALSGQERGVVATLGTGTAFLWADGDSVRHLCGTGVGGGTLKGLCRALAGTERICQIQDMASRGDVTKVDLTMRDIIKDATSTLDLDMTAANFGKLAEDHSPADLTAGAVNLILQVIGTMTVLACQCCNSNTVILTGALTKLAQAGPNFALFERLYGIHYMIPENAAFATAIGAALYSLRHDA